MRLRTSVLGTAKLENERLFLFGYCIRVENTLISYAYVCTHTHFLKLQSFLIELSVHPYTNLFLQQNMQGKSYFFLHVRRTWPQLVLCPFFFLICWWKLVTSLLLCKSVMANVSYVKKLEAVYTKRYYKIMICYQFGQRSNLVKYYSEVNRKRACLILSGIILKKKKF